MLLLLLLGVYSCSLQLQCTVLLFKQRELISARETSRQRIAYFSPRPSRAGVQFCFASTETIRLIRDGEKRGKWVCM